MRRREFVSLVAGSAVSLSLPASHEATRVAAYVQKVLSGAKRADLPIEQPVKFELIVNLKTARSIGLTIDRDFLLHADDLID